MKKLIALYFIFLSSILYAQTNTDIIIKHTGEKLNVNVLSVDDKIVFTYPNETVNNTIPKNCVGEIIFRSGRIEICSEKIVVNGKEDWEKVIITDNPEDVKGLVRKGDISSSASNTWNFKNKNGVEKKATMKIKEEAAALKAHIVLIQDESKENMTSWSGASSSKNGVAYGY